MPSLEGVSRRTTHETVLDTLRKAILNGSLAAGTPLVQADLSAQLGVSKTPIREAIRDLAAAGLIDFDSYRSAVVHTPTLEEAREIYEMRLALEPLAVRKAVGKIPAAALDRADELRTAMESTEEVGDWIELNSQFHELLLDPAAPRLNAMIVGLRNAAAIQVAWSLHANPRQMTQSNADHARIVDGYRRSDVEASVEATAHHLRATLEAIESYERARAEQAG